MSVALQDGSLGPVALVIGSGTIKVPAFWWTAAQDTGHGSSVLFDEAPSIFVAVSSSDTGAGSEKSVLSVSSVETVLGSDTGTVRAAVAGSDTGSGAEAVSIRSSLIGSDLGFGADSSNSHAVVLSADAGSGSESSSGGNSLYGSQVYGEGSYGTGSYIYVSAAEAALGTESLSVRVGSADSGMGAEQHSVCISDFDHGVGSVSWELTSDIAAADAGSGQDALLYAGVISADYSSGFDLQHMIAVLADTDTGIGWGSGSLAAGLYDYDAGFLLDVSGSITSFSADAAEGQDIGVLAGPGPVFFVQDSDAGHGTESLPYQWGASWGVTGLILQVLCPQISMSACSVELVLFAVQAQRTYSEAVVACCT
jgi:hypothetical protein